MAPPDPAATATLVDVTHAVLVNLVGFLAVHRAGAVAVRAVDAKLTFACFRPSAEGAEPLLSPENLAFKLTNCLHHVCVGLLAGAGAWDGWGAFATALLARDAAAARDAALALLLEPSANAQRLVPVTMSYFVFDLVHFHLWSASSKRDGGLMLCHHALSLVLWPVALVYGFAHQWLLLYVAYELSSAALVANWIIAQTGHKASKAYLASGTVFTATFLLVRCGALPFSLAALWLAPPWLAETAAKVAALPPAVRWSSAGLVLPHLLTFVWAPKVVKGYAKAVFPARRGIGKKAAEEKSR